MKAFYVAMIGVTSLLGAASVSAATPEETYKATCAACHDAGVAGAPKLGDKAAWAPRIKAGKDAQSDADFCLVARVEAFIAGQSALFTRTSSKSTPARCKAMRHSSPRLPAKSK